MLTFEQPSSLTPALVPPERSPRQYESKTLDRLNVTPEEEELYKQISQERASHPAVAAAEQAYRDAGDQYTKGHTDRVTELAVYVGIRMRLPRAVLDGMYVGGKIHDTGKLWMREAVHAERELTEAEKLQLRTHPELGVAFGKRYRAGPIALGIAGHHHDKNKDPSHNYGAPAGMVPEGQRSLLAERIMAACDIYDALRSERPYRSEILSAADAHDKVAAMLDMGELGEGHRILQVLRAIVPAEGDMLAKIALSHAGQAI